jgi:hypothetical protein
MTQQVADLLRKITYIEADIEIQKQILFSLPSSDREGMERQVALIREKKDRIQSLRESIRAVDPEAHDRILVFEKAVSRFRELAASRHFLSVTTLADSGECSLALQNGRTLQCLVKALDEQGTWTVFTPSGEVLEFRREEVVPEERPPL